VVVDPKHKTTAWSICLNMAEQGLLAKPTHDHIIRLAPPLVISDSELDTGMTIIEKAFADSHPEH
jgi:ornithine--oxo-acid transaminase